MKRLFAVEQPNRAATDQKLNTTQSPAQPPMRVLVVGRGIAVSGEIKSCECLVVEGTVEANVVCRELRIAASGVFKGKARVSAAEIIGGFGGDLEVDDRLLVRASGKVTANLRYRQIEIERGGEISGDVQSAAEASEDRRDLLAKRRA